MNSVWRVYVHYLCRKIATLTERNKAMSQEITDLKAAEVADAGVKQRAAALIAALQAKIVTLESQVADAAQIPPVTAAMVTSTQALDAAITAVTLPAA